MKKLEGGNNVRRERGFTLIELLVVIAIIGVLSSVVLTSLNSARGKGNDAKVEAQLSSVRGSAEIYYGNHGDYSTASDCATGMFADTGSGMHDYMLATNYPSGVFASMHCTAAGSSYMVYAQLPFDGGTNPRGYWCIDSLGHSLRETTAPASGDTSCNASGS